MAGVCTARAWEKPPRRLVGLSQPGHGQLRVAASVTQARSLTARLSQRVAMRRTAAPADAAADSLAAPVGRPIEAGLAALSDLSGSPESCRDGGRRGCLKMSSRIADISQRQAARIAGSAYLIIIVLAFFANFFVLDRLTEPGDAAATVSNIADSEALFRSGIVALMAVFVADAVVAWALYIFFRRENRDLSLLTAWFRLLYTAMFGIALLNLAVVVLLVAGADAATALGAGQRDTQAMLFLDAYDYGWAIALVCFGVHLLLLGVIVFKSDYAPRIIGILLVLAGLGYLVDSLARFSLLNYEDYRDLFLLLLAVPAIAGEFSLTGWLLLRGGKEPSHHAQARQPLPD